MRRDPERLAWLVLWVSFAVFCFLCISIPLSVRWYIINATDTEEATIETISGTVLVEEPGVAAPIGVQSSRRIREGSSITTDANAKAIITLFDKSTVVIFPETEVTLLRTRSPRFSWSPRPNVFILSQKGGRIRVGAAQPVEAPLHFEVRSPHMLAQLEEGSYSVEVSNEATEIVVRDGRAIVSAAGQTVSLKARERSIVPLGKEPSSPLPAARNLIVNGDFREPLPVGWEAYNDQGVDGGLVDGSAEIISEDGRQAVRFRRLGESGNHCETGVVQRINRDLSDYTSLKLRADVKLTYQSLSGGGYLSTEFPIIIRIDYKDVYGSEAHWTHGFYYQNRDNLPIQNGEEIPRFVWFPYEKDDLLESLDPRPFYIISIRIYASGWDYEAMVSEIALIVE
ncbi:MAG: FecR domain-containing protein [Anaerolineae bacterium]